MGIVKSIADFFRSAHGVEAKPVDRYGVLSPLMATGDYVKAAQDYFKILISDKKIGQRLIGREAGDQHLAKAIDAYKLYLHGLPAHDQAMERQVPLSTVLLALETISGNIELIEDHFNELFGALVSGSGEASIRSSSLVTIGYLETADAFTVWLGRFAAHLVFEDDATVSPFWTKEMLVNAQAMGEFVGNNLNKWSPRYKGLLEEIKAMQRKGSDVSIKTGEQYMDEFVHDNQFTNAEQVLMTASLRSPIMWLIDNRLAAHQQKLELLTTRKDWLISKIALEEARIHGMDPSSPDYKRLQKATDHYASLISKYEQKIERMRA